MTLHKKFFGCLDAFQKSKHPKNQQKDQVEYLQLREF